MRFLTRCIWITMLYIGLSCSSNIRLHVVVAIKADPDQINRSRMFSICAHFVYGVFPRLLESNLIPCQGLFITNHYWQSVWILAGSYLLTYFLRSDVFWRRGKGDCQGYQIHIWIDQSPGCGQFQKDQLQMLDIDEKGSLDRAIKIINDSTIVFRFKKANPLQIYDTNLQPGFLPYHILKDVKPSDLRTHAFNQKPLSAGSYYLKEWKKQEQLVFQSRKTVLSQSRKDRQDCFPYHSRIYNALDES